MFGVLHIKSPCPWWKLLSWWDYFLLEFVNPYNPTLSVEDVSTSKCSHSNAKLHPSRLFLAGAGENFGEMTAKYLSRVKREKGIMLAVCTSDYGEMTASPFCTYYEMKSAVEWGIDVLPLQVEDEWQPNPPCGAGHLDKDQSALGYIDLVFTPGTVRLDCRNKPVEAIAREIAAVLRKPL